MKVKFTKVFSVKIPGDVKEYDDQYAKWLFSLGVAEEFVEKVEEPDLTTKEEKVVKKRVTKNAKG